MGSMWAVAVNTFRQALRMRVAVVFILLLVVLLPVMGFSMSGDGTLKGRLQTFVSYGLSLTSLLLCLLTIIVSIYTLTSDLRERQIYTVITKPIRRFELLLGKLLGVVMLDVGLLVLFAGTIYVIATCTPRLSKASPAELAQARNEFFTARASLTPAEEDVSKEVIKAFKKLKDNPQTMEVFKGLSNQEILKRLTKSKQLEKRAAPVGYQLVWEFENVKPLDPNESLFIRFKYDVSVNPPDLQIYGKWVVGDLRPLRYGQVPKTRIFDLEQKDTIRTFHEIEVPAEVIAADGHLDVAFINALGWNNTLVIFPLEDGLEVLYKADTFTANFIRGVLLIMLRLVFLAVLGLAGGTFLSFPVSLLFCLMVFFTANFSGFIMDSFEYLSDNASSIYKFTFSPIIRFLPQFDLYNPTNYLVDARLVGWEMVVGGIFWMICVKAVLVSIIGWLIFRYKEIAKVTV